MDGVSFKWSDADGLELAAEELRFVGVVTLSQTEGGGVISVPDRSVSF